MSFQHPVIVVPGITASELRDEYPTEPESLWKILGRDFERIALHPDDTRYERMEPARLSADRVFGIPYAEFIRELRHDLTRRGDEPTPVYPFAYDWRQPLERLEARLAEFVDEVIDRTKLMRHYHRDGYWDDPRVDLVGHSMGGLIITGYLEASGGAQVRKVATLATPYGGSFEAVLKVVVGTADLGPRRSTSSERETARVTPALYHLVPDIDGTVHAADGLNDDLFEPSAWQPGVLRTIAEYVRRFGLRREPADATDEAQDESRMSRAEDLFSQMLGRARAHRDRIDTFELEAAGMTPNDWLCLVGVGAETRVALRIERDESGSPYFNLTSADRRNGYLPPDERKARKERGDPVAKLWETGDGTVSYRGAKPPFLDLRKLVCLSAREFGYWEIGDKLLNAGAGFHGILPKMNLAQKLVVAHLKGPAGGAGTAHEGLRGRRPPDLARNARWDPPLVGLKERRVTDD